MLDYKSIITKHYALGMSGREIAETLPEGTKAGVNKFLAAFRECKRLSYFVHFLFFGLICRRLLC